MQRTCDAVAFETVGLQRSGLRLLAIIYSFDASKMVIKWQKDGVDFLWIDWVAVTQEVEQVGYKSGFVVRSSLYVKVSVGKISGKLRIPYVR